ncbi:hypothetical protein ACFY89_29090 [Achromobacter spanius]|uniref:hypothetical protein n=1 Tax=Achromobacter spanius TaxID=217203 RepID=UPI0036E0A80A
MTTEEKAVARGVARPVQFRAVHERSAWRPATFESIEQAKCGRRGARKLFAEAGWRSFEEEGKAHFVVIWNPLEVGTAWVLKNAPELPDGFQEVKVPVSVAVDYNDRGGASIAELETLFS